MILPGLKSPVGRPVFIVTKNRNQKSVIEAALFFNKMQFSTGLVL